MNTTEVFLIAMATYFFTREARGSLWDCGEFVSSAYKMELPHPPGAPMFTLIGRFFIILFGDNPMTAVDAYLRDHPEFEIDTAMDNKLQITVAPRGFLKRIG